VGGRTEEAFVPLPDAGAVELPEEPAAHVGPGPDQRAAARSLMADLEAEVNYQKTRAVYVADRVRAAAFFGGIGAAFGFIALIGLTVGAILTLDQWMATSLACAIVVGVEALLSYYFLRRASQRWSKIMEALGMNEERVEE